MRPISPSGPPPTRDTRAKSPDVSPALKRVLARAYMYPKPHDVCFRGWV